MGFTTGGGKAVTASAAALAKAKSLGFGGAEAQAAPPRPLASVPVNSARTVLPPDGGAAPVVRPSCCVDMMDVASTEAGPPAGFARAGDEVDRVDPPCRTVLPPDGGPAPAADPSCRADMMQVDAPPGPSAPGPGAPGPGFGHPAASAGGFASSSGAAPSAPPPERVGFGTFSVGGGLRSTGAAAPSAALERMKAMLFGDEPSEPHEKARDDPEDALDSVLRDLHEKKSHASTGGGGGGGQARGFSAPRGKGKEIVSFAAAASAARGGLPRPAPPRPAMAAAPRAPAVPPQQPPPPQPPPPAARPPPAAPRRRSLPLRGAPAPAGAAAPSRGFKKPRPSLDAPVHGGGAAGGGPSVAADAAPRRAPLAPNPMPKAGVNGQRPKFVAPRAQPKPPPPDGAAPDARRASMPPRISDAGPADQSRRSSLPARLQPKTRVSCACGFNRQPLNERKCPACCGYCGCTLERGDEHAIHIEGCPNDSGEVFLNWIPKATFSGETFSSRRGPSGGGLGLFPPSDRELSEAPPWQPPPWLEAALR